MFWVVITFFAATAVAMPHLPGSTRSIESAKREKLEQEIEQDLPRDMGVIEPRAEDVAKLPGLLVRLDSDRYAERRKAFLEMLELFQNLGLTEIAERQITAETSAEVRFAVSRAVAISKPVVRWSQAKLLLLRRIKSHATITQLVDESVRLRSDLAAPSREILATLSREIQSKFSYQRSGVALWEAETLALRHETPNTISNYQSAAANIAEILVDKGATDLEVQDGERISIYYRKDGVGYRLNLSREGTFSIQLSQDMGFGNVYHSWPLKDALPRYYTVPSRVKLDEVKPFRASLRLDGHLQFHLLTLVIKDSSESSEAGVPVLHGYFQREIPGYHDDGTDQITDEFLTSEQLLVK